MVHLGKSKVDSCNFLKNREFLIEKPFCSAKLSKAGAIKMKTITIEVALEQAPFRPFDLMLESGRTVHVRHPDFLLFNGPKTVCVVAEGEHIRVHDIDHLTGLTYKNTRAKNGSLSK